LRGNQINLAPPLAPLDCASAVACAAACCCVESCLLPWRTPRPGVIMYPRARAGASPAGTRRQTLLGCSPSGEPKGAAILCRFGRWSLVVEWSPRTDYDGLLPRAVTSLASPNEQSLLLSSA